MAHLLKDAQEEADSKKTSVVLDKTSKSHDRSPAEYKTANIPRWSRDLM